MALFYEIKQETLGFTKTSRIRNYVIVQYSLLECGKNGKEAIIKGINAKSEILKRKRKVEGKGRGKERKRKRKKEERKGGKGNWK